MKKIKYKKTEPERIDKFLKEELTWSRNKIITLIKDLRVLVNDEWVLKPGTMLNENDLVTILDQIEKIKIPAVNFPLKIVYETDHYLVVNKPSGLLVHASNFDEEDTLASRVKNYFESKNIVFPSDDQRWGICHRLDKNTSGLVLVAKSLNDQEILMNMIKDHKIHKEYLALIHGHLSHKKIKVDVPIKRDHKIGTKMVTSTSPDAKYAISYFEVIKEYENFSLIKCILETGRTHQIRVHLLYLNNPIINDPLYSKTKRTTKYGQYLFANRMSFIDPFNKMKIDINIPIDKHFEDYIKEHK
ncbi:MAG: RluA family pseudouridine synthase [Mycoplasmoidaceae bacterium]